MTWDLIKHALFPPAEASSTVTFVYWLALVSFAGFEFFAPQFQDLHRGRRWPTNFFLGLFNMALVPLIPISALWGSQWAKGNGIGLLNLLGSSWWLFAVIATIAIQSFASYATHLLFHKAPWLWRIHRVHHFDTAVDVSTGLRHHPLEMFFTLMIDFPVAIVCGLVPAALIIYGTADAMFALFSHANIRLPVKLDRTLRLMLVTPRIHAIHHSAHKSETDSNYGNVFTIWDRVFRTYCDLRADNPEKIQFGLVELRDLRASDLWWQLKSPIYVMGKVKSGQSARDFG